MFWSHRRIFRTVKFKITLWYAAIFAVSSLLGLGLIALFLEDNLHSTIDRELNNSARSLIYLYWTGNRFKQYDREISPSRLPAAAQEAFQKRLPGVTLVAAFENQMPDQVYQTAYGVLDRKIYELRLESNGSVYAKQLFPTPHLPLLLQALSDLETAEGAEHFCYLLQSPDGTILARSANAPPPGASLKMRTCDIGGIDYRLMRIELFDGTILELGRSFFRQQQIVQRYLLYFLSGFGILLAFGTLCGWLIARRFISGVDRVCLATRQIAEGDFSHRVAPGRDGAEIDELVQTFNSMSANTERLVNELQTVTDNIAHDLRTPLTRMRGVAEVTVAGPQTLENYREMAGIIAEECGQMLSLINNMLEITRTEHIAELKHETFDLGVLLRNVHELLLPLAEERNLRFRLELPPDPAMIDAEKFKLQRLVANLLDNALKFTPDGGEILLALDDADSEWRIRVCDNGCGIPPEAIEHVFDRFFRSDPSRSRPGNGLGLAMVRAIAVAHGGHVEVESEVGKGTVFTVFLPKIARNLPPQQRERERS